MNLKIDMKWKIEKKEVEDKAKQVLFDSMMKMHEIAVRLCPVAFGGLRNSIKVFPSAPGFKSYTLADGVTYGKDVEYGSKPHYINPEVLKQWASKVLGDEGAAYPVAKKIAKFGTEASPFFRPALAQVKSIWVKRFWAMPLAK